MKIKVKKMVEELIMKYPNDYDLGLKVRELFNQIKKIKKDVVQQENNQEK